MPESPEDETTQAPQNSEPDPEPTEPQAGDDPWADPDKARREIEKLRKENASQRTKAKDRDALAKKVAEFEQAQLTEQERVAQALTDTQQRVQALKASAVRAEVRAQAADLFADTDDARAHLEARFPEYVDDDGVVDEERIKADLADLLERKPHLGKAESHRRPAPDPLQGSSGNGRPTSDPADEFAGFMQRALTKGR